MDNVQRNKIQKCNEPSSISFRCTVFWFQIIVQYKVPLRLPQNVIETVTCHVIVPVICKLKVSSSSYSITSLGHCGLFRSQLSYRLVVSYVVVQVVVFLLDDNSEVVLGACCLPKMKVALFILSFIFLIYVYLIFTCRGICL
jgi:hypothetical protein